jgi:hypothetical protein
MQKNRRSGGPSTDAFGASDKRMVHSRVVSIGWFDFQSTAGLSRFEVGAHPMV